jgi:hypothetical protein
MFHHRRARPGAEEVVFVLNSRFSILVAGVAALRSGSCARTGCHHRSPGRKSEYVVRKDRKSGGYRDEELQYDLTRTSLRRSRKLRALISNKVIDRKHRFSSSGASAQNRLAVSGLERSSPTAGLSFRVAPLTNLVGAPRPHSEYRMRGLQYPSGRVNHPPEGQVGISTAATGRTAALAFHAGAVAHQGEVATLAARLPLIAFSFGFGPLLGGGGTGI